ncbi:efflux RND transporter permease subunit [Thalassotalea aquiviva]|uniref:efflux RND transporter permease subunit n=1 Tax=Thalassotalea aquiviva TaxID=3242415 RepID=UPI00352B17D2
MIDLLVKNGRFITLIIALLMVSGLASLHLLPRMEDPSMTNRFASIITHFPGASAERVETLVTEKIEHKIQKLAEIEYTASSSRAQISLIQVKLKGEVNDSEQVFSRIRDLLNDVSVDLPPGTSTPTLDDERSFAYTQLIALNWQGSSPPNMITLARYAKELQAQLRLVPNTDIVEIYGQNNEEVLVQVDQDKAAMASISLQQISQAIRQADAKVPAGKLVNEHNQMQIEIRGALDSLERIRAIPVYASPSSTLTVGDLATVSKQLQSPLSEMAIVNGQPALVVATRMVQEYRVDIWSNKVAQQLALFQQQLPNSIAVDVLFNQNHYTENRLADLVNNVIMGFTLIALVLFFTLGVRSALIVVLSLPLTVMFTLTVMNYYGLPIHQMSVTGLVVALGIMVDNAIVMADTIKQNKQQGIRGIDALSRAIRHLWMPLLGSTLTTILAFMPIVLMPGDAGEFVGGIALSVIFALIGSYVISHTVVAGLSGRFIKVSPEHCRWYHHGLAFNRFEKGFNQSLNFTFANPKITILLVLILPCTGFWVAQQLDEQFFPSSDRDMFQIEVYMPAQTSLFATRSMTEKISKKLQQHPEIKSSQWFIGRSAPSFYYNLISNKDGMPNYAQAMITTTDFDAANQLIPLLQKQFDDLFPQAQIMVRKLEQGPPFNAPIEIRLYGPNLDQLQRLGNEVRRMLVSTEDVTHTRATLSSGMPKIWLSVDEDTMASLNLNLSDIAKQLETGLDGSSQGSIIEATESINVRVKGAKELALSLAHLDNFPVISAQQQDFIPLSAVSQVHISPTLGAIPHRNGKRVNVIEGYLRADILPSVVLNRLNQKLTQSGFALPMGYSLEIGGEADARDKAVGKLLSSVGVIFTLLIAVVVMSFNSFRISLIIFTSALMSTGLGLLSVFVFNYPFGFTVIIALLGLMGLAINSAIVILAELKTSAQAVKGNIDAIRTAVLSCTRHISSTTITTAFGFLPLILSGGGFWPPFAIAVAGGTVLTTLLSFYLVPASFYLFAKHRPFSAKIEQHDVL